MRVRHVWRYVKRCCVMVCDDMTGVARGVMVAGAVDVDVDVDVDADAYM